VVIIEAVKPAFQTRGPQRAVASVSKLDLVDLAAAVTRVEEEDVGRVVMMAFARAVTTACVPGVVTACARAVAQEAEGAK
jgi:hypothetical protein